MKIQTPYPPNSLRANLNYEPQELKFGTSGRRGEVIHLTQLEVYLNAFADMIYLQSLSAEEGGIERGDAFYLACDLRPSSTHYQRKMQGRGEIAQAVAKAIEDAGMHPVYLGAIPTPALMHYAVAQGCGSIMVTGSHIPFDRNGFKTNTARGELLKKDEEPIAREVAKVRDRLYRQSFAESPFDAEGRFRVGHRAMPPLCDAGSASYLTRYLDFFAVNGHILDDSTEAEQRVDLSGKRVLVYQHSAVGRDMLVEVLARAGAEVLPVGRSDQFMPIDTENMDEERLAVIQRFLDEAVARHGSIDAIVSTDGDSDRPLVLGVTPEGKARFFSGDLLGMVVAEYLGADAVVVPISCNDAIDRSPLRDCLEPKTRIGSPHVIAGMEQARAKGRRLVCGWEANGGFLLGSDFSRYGKTLTALPTRDALLPILCVLFAAQEKGMTLPELFDTLPKRFSKAALLKNFQRAIGQKIVACFTPEAPDEKDAIRAELQSFFLKEHGFGTIVELDYTDGIRLTFDNEEVVHFRPSGNADEFRIYAVADTQERADEIAREGIREPDGILRKIEWAVRGKMRGT